MNRSSPSDHSNERPSTSLQERLRPFVDAGLLPRLPTWWQIRQGELEMLPYVISTDATTEEGYFGSKLGHPLVRQVLILSLVGRDHLRPGTAMAARLSSICKHLHLTYHQGMPVFDLQLAQTHPHGLEVLRERTQELLERRTRQSQRLHRFASLILREPDEYYRRFLGAEGWIARAERFDYPSPEVEDAAFPPEFFSLVGLLNYCAASFPSSPAELALHRVPAHVANLLGRRFREGGQFGWFSTHRNLARS